MFQKLLDRFVGDWQDTPNKFTLEMGKLIRRARNDQKLSQAELAKSLYIRQASISEMENGKRVVNSIELVYLSLALNKPILYYFPNESLSEMEEELSPLYQELLLQAMRLTQIDVKKLIAQTKALGDLQEDEEQLWRLNNWNQFNMSRPTKIFNHNRFFELE